MEKPLVSLLVLNWNGKECIDECLQSLLKTDYGNFEIIVVDNGSTDDSLERIRKYPRTKVCALNENIGYAAGNNSGFKHARGDFIATVNNDVVVEPGWLKQPLEFFGKDPLIGIIACRQMNYDVRDTIDCLYAYSGMGLLFEPMGSGKKYSPKKLYTQPGYVIAAGGASAIYRKELLDSLSGFDETYYSYHEESDLCMRAFLRGWKCAYAPDAVVYHKGSFSFNRTKNTLVFYHERNRIRFIYKFFPWTFIVKNACGILVMELRIIRVLFFKRKTVRAYFSARFQGFRGLKRLREARKANVHLFARKRKIFEAIRKNKKLDIINL
jgi:GT2 family glycosyltransferase